MTDLTPYLTNCQLYDVYTLLDDGASSPTLNIKWCDGVASMEPCKNVTKQQQNNMNRFEAYRESIGGEDVIFKSLWKGNLCDSVGDV